MKFSNVQGRLRPTLCLGLKNNGSDALVRQSLDCLLGIAPRDAGLGVLSGRRLMSLHPGLKHPTPQSLRRGWPFWRHLPQHEGRHSCSDGGVGYSLRPLRGHRKMSKLEPRLRRSPQGRAPEVALVVECFFYAKHVLKRAHFTLWHWRILSFWRPRVRPAKFLFCY